MSAFCLDLHAPAPAPAAAHAPAVSAPPELDSDRMERPQERAAEPCPDPGAFRRLPGGLGAALEEELALLAESAASEPPGGGQEADLLSLFRQKEKDLVMAARLGKALLERNQELSRQYERMNKELNEKLEHLEQEKHELRRRLESREGEWEGRVAELETDVRQLQGELEKQRAQLREVDREKSRAVSELSEQNHRLLEQLSRAAEVERQLSTQVHSLRDDFREKSVSTSQHMSRLESLQAEQGLEIKMLSERKRELERRVSAVLEENELLQSAVDELRERSLVLERQCHEKDLQLRQSQAELQEVRLSHRQLSARLEELAEERSLQGLGSHPASLLCEIEQSMEQEELEQEREQLRLQMWEAYCQVRSLCSHLRGNDITDSALSTDSSMDESSETSSAKDVPTGSLHASLLELRRLTQNLLDGNESTGSRRSDEEALEDQVRKLSEELRELRELYEAEQERARGSQAEVLELHNQVSMEHSAHVLSGNLAAQIKVVCQQAFLSDDCLCASRWRCCQWSYAPCERKVSVCGRWQKCTSQVSSCRAPSETGMKPLPSMSSPRSGRGHSQNTHEKSSKETPPHIVRLLDSKGKGQKPFYTVRQTDCLLKGSGKHSLQFIIEGNS
uniref:BICD family like cargo adaptor 1 n=1 Tax=Scleropages formosus TaxID=113540 RepID=A0A8D0CBQ3_SCLFO